MKQVFTCFALAVLLIGNLAKAAIPELHLLQEYIVDGVEEGNLSGLSYCQQQFFTVSDRVDDKIYQLHFDPESSVVSAVAVALSIQNEVQRALPVTAREMAIGYWRRGLYDFEGISCDAQGNAYLISESMHALLQVTPDRRGYWQPLPETLFEQAKRFGLLQQFNAGFEGVAVNEDASQIWLAAEREVRGLFQLKQTEQGWRCAEPCLLLHENQFVPAVLFANDFRISQDFSDLTWYQGKLYSLERAQHQICRRSSDTGEAEQCWSFVETALQPERRYPGQKYGMAEGLWLDQRGAWVVLDNNQQARIDGERRPIIWHFALPEGAW